MHRLICISFDVLSHNLLGISCEKATMKARMKVKKCTFLPILSRQSASLCAVMRLDAASAVRMPKSGCTHVSSAVIQILSIVLSMQDFASNPTHTAPCSLFSHFLRIFQHEWQFLMHSLDFLFFCCFFLHVVRRILCPVTLASEFTFAKYSQKRGSISNVTLRNLGCTHPFFYAQ